MKKPICYLSVSVGFFTLSAASILLMPRSRDIANSTAKTSLLINGLLFWIPFALGFVMLWIADIQRKKLMKAPRYKRIGLISFCTGPIATVFDALAVLSGICLLVLLIAGLSSSYFAYIVLFIFALSLDMHAVFNGRVYRTIRYCNHKIKVRRVENNEG